MLEKDLITELHDYADALDKSIDEMGEAGIDLANKEADYQTLAAQKALIEKDSGTPITFISTFIKGDKEIAERRRLRDIAESKYKVCQEKVNSLKIELRIIDAQAGREWSRRDDSSSDTPNFFE